MNELKVFNFQDNEVRTAENGSDRWFNLSDVCKILGLRNVSASKSQIKNNKMMMLETTDRMNRKQLATFIDENGALQLIAKSRKQEAIKLAEKLNLKIMGVLALTKEQQTLGIIQNSFKHLEQKPQHKVGNYIIDLYFPELKLAIECDENGHFSYSHKDDLRRQRYIEECLGCNFIRFNPDKIGFEIGQVINQIIKVAYVNESVKSV